MWHMDTVMLESCRDPLSEDHPSESRITVTRCGHVHEASATGRLEQRCIQNPEEQQSRKIIIPSFSNISSSVADAITVPIKRDDQQVVR